jgi:hypothetical protein
MDISSLNELIARSSKIAYEAGVESQRQKTITLLKSLPKEFRNNDYVVRAVAKALAELRS